MSATNASPSTSGCTEARFAIAQDGSAWFAEVEDGRFVERTAKRGATFRDLDLYEAAYESEKVQFYRLVDIDFARRLRQVAVTHPVLGHDRGREGGIAPRIRRRRS